MTLILTDQEVRGLVQMEPLIDALEEGVRDEARGLVSSVPRMNVDAPGGFLRIMPVVLAGRDRMGFKAFNGSAARGVRYLVSLYRESTGELLALLDGDHLTSLRTGATTGLAARLLTTGDGCREVGVIGSGVEARTNLAGLCAARAVERVLVFSPTPSRSAAYAEEMTEALGVPVETCSHPAEAASCRAVLVATNTGLNSGRVALEGAWLSEDATVFTIGSTMPGLREIDTEVFSRASRIVLDTPHAVHESGDILAGREQGTWPEARVTCLADHVLGDGAPGDGITVFKSVGTAAQDVIAASLAHDAADEALVGRSVPFLEPRVFRLTGKE